ncbi:MAG: prolyl oligopeptidase family serine peptidase [Nibricoccus sp.]
MAIAAHAASFDFERQTPVAADEEIPTMDFFRPAILQSPSLNSSGTHAAAVVSSKDDNHQLMVWELGTQKLEVIGGIGEKDIYSVCWLNDKRLLFQLATRKLYGLGLLAANVGHLHDAYPVLQYYGSQIVSVPKADPLKPLVWNRYDSIETRKDLGCARITSGVDTGKVVDITNATTDWNAVLDARDNNDRHILSIYPIPPTGMTVRYIANKNGEPEFAETWDGNHSHLWRLVDGKWEKTSVDLDKISVIDYGEEPGQLLVRGPRQEGKPNAVQFMNGTTGELGEVLLQDTGYDFQTPYGFGWTFRDPKTQKIIGLTFARRALETVWFNEAYRQLQKIIEGLFPGVATRIIGCNEESTRFLVETYSDRQPPVYSWVDLTARTGSLIKKSRPWIDPQRMQPMSVVKFKTRDGKQLDAYLTLPAGTSKTNPAPLVVLPHGGPWVRDCWGFDGEVQFLASRGYAVLQPNYRGSLGSDWMFANTDRYDFLKMHDDVTDATRTLIKSGLIDRNRVAIMGGSFGGYLSVSGVVHEPTLYRCAVTIAGVFDWERQIQSKKYYQYDGIAYSYLVANLGDPKTNPQKFEAISPNRQANQIRVPVFVAAGKEDFIVDVEQADLLIAALEKNKVPHEKLYFSGEGHGMARLKNQVKLYDAIAAFLDKNLKQAKPPTAAP